MAKSPDLTESAKIFLMADKNQEEIEQAGHQSLAALYGCIPGTILDFERAMRFSSKVVSSSTYLPPERL